jgi:hypothetical protein
MCCKLLRLRLLVSSAHGPDLLRKQRFNYPNGRHFNCSCHTEVSRLDRSQASSDPERGVRKAMAYKETFWMACDSTDQLRAEYGPFHTRMEAEAEARKLGFGYLLRYEHLIGANEEIEDVHCIFIELAEGPMAVPKPSSEAIRLHTRCATCGESATHDLSYMAEVWADIHEFEHSRHMVRLFEHTFGDGLKEIADWRSAA